PTGQTRSDSSAISSRWWPIPGCSAITWNPLRIVAIVCVAARGLSLAMYEDMSLTSRRAETEIRYRFTYSGHTALVFQPRFHPARYLHLHARHGRVRQGPAGWPPAPISDLA